MRYVHRLTTRSSPEVVEEIQALGVKKVSAGPIIVLFQVAEDEPIWPAVTEWMRTREVSDWLTSVFTEDEIVNAAWLGLRPDWHHGYPQPKEDDFGYLEATYDLTDYCPACGIGLKQNAPFQMKGEPKWGRRELLQLHWVFDEYFATPQAAALFAEHGVGTREVLTRKGKRLETVLQLVVSEEVDVRTDGLAYERCGTCGREKFLPIQHGFLPALARKPRGEMVRTRQDFGSGASSFNEILVSQSLARKLTSSGKRGVSFVPLAWPPTGSGQGATLSEVP